MLKRVTILLVTLLTGIMAGWAIRDMSGGQAQFKLNEAAGRGDLREMKRLVSEGADPRAEAYDKSTGQGGGTPLFAAAANGEAEAVEYLIQNGANVNSVEATETPLDMASYRRNQADKTISILEAHGAKKLSELNNKEPNNKGGAPNTCPATSLIRHDRSTFNPLSKPRRRAGVGGL